MNLNKIKKLIIRFLMLLKRTSFQVIVVKWPVILTTLLKMRLTSLQQRIQTRMKLEIIWNGALTLKIKKRLLKMKSLENSHTKIVLNLRARFREWNQTLIFWMNYNNKCHPKSKLKIWQVHKNRKRKPWPIDLNLTQIWILTM